MTGLFAADPDREIAVLWDRLRTLARQESGAADLPNEGASGDFAKLYLPIAAPRRTPFAIGQLGQSLDGHIATSSGASHYITGPESLIHLHRLRALADAVVVGWRTVAADDPRLTVRRVTGDNPFRVVIDLEGRLSPSHRVFAREPPGALRLVAAGVPPLDGVDSIVVAAPAERFEPAAVIAALAARGCRRILIEGGGATVSSFLAAGALDRLHLTIAPLITGEGRRGIRLPSVGALRNAICPAARQIAMGRDVLFDLDLSRTTLR